MGLSAAERQRRSRAHKKGDHTLCDPERCEAVTSTVTTVTDLDVTEPVTDPALSRLGGRGRQLYREVLEAHPDLGPRERVLLEEAARSADRLERLDRLLRGDTDEFASVRFANGRTELVVDKTLAEARAQQASLARLLSELRQMLAPAASKPTAPSAPVSSPMGQKQGGGKLVDLRQRVAARRAAASG